MMMIAWFKNLFVDLEKKPLRSSLGFAYPPSRDNPFNVSEIWLDDKRELDGAEGLWRIHDKLYDFDQFVDVHPGGSDWLSMTKGTDITEAFESYHVRELPKSLLIKYYARDAKTKRNSPFTFEEDGFYATLKRRVRDRLSNVDEEKIDTFKSKLYTDLLLIGFLVTSILAGRYASLVFTAIAGIILALLANAAHNFFHQRDNFRMFYFDLTLMSSRSWRISHALSHHLYPNTILDIEVSYLEPFLNYLPQGKNRTWKFISWLITPFVYGLAFVGHFVLEIGAIVFYNSKANWELLIPFGLLITIVAFGRSLLVSLAIFLAIEIVGGFVFSLIGVNAAHHHPYIFHDGDTARPKHEMDWGVYQMDATRDRKEFVYDHFRVLVAFGDHVLHHLFPTIDHGRLKHLYPVLRETCNEFGFSHKLSTQLKLMRGQFLQLINDKPRTVPPRPLKPNNNQKSKLNR